MIDPQTRLAQRVRIANYAWGLQNTLSPDYLDLIEIRYKSPKPDLTPAEAMEILKRDKSKLTGKE